MQYSREPPGYMIKYAMKLVYSRAGELISSLMSTVNKNKEFENFAYTQRHMCNKFCETTKPAVLIYPNLK